MGKFSGCGKQVRGSRTGFGQFPGLESRIINRGLAKPSPIENECSRWTTKFRSFGPPGALISYRTKFPMNWKKLEIKPVHRDRKFSIGPHEGRRHANQDNPGPDQGKRRQAACKSRQPGSEYPLALSASIH